MFAGIIRMIFLPLLVAFSSSASAAEYCAVPNLDVLDAVVRVQGPNVEGSGVVIADNLVVTAAHVIEDLDLLNVKLGGIQKYAELVSTLPERDLALLKVDTMGQRPIPIMIGGLQYEDSVWTVGFPEGGAQLVSRGVYTGQRNGDLQTTASVNMGQSGGGLLTCVDGQHVLAGVIHAFGAIDMGNYYIRLDDYSISIPVEDVMALIYADSGY